MNSPQKSTFKLSLLDCFVVMVSMSVLVSIDVFAFRQGWNGEIETYWWRRNSSFEIDGWIVLLLVHIFVVIMSVMAARTVRALYRKETLQSDEFGRKEDVPVEVYPVDEAPEIKAVSAPPSVLVDLGRTVASLFGGCLFMLGSYLLFVGLAFLIRFGLGGIDPVHGTLYALLSGGVFTLGCYMLRYVNLALNLDRNARPAGAAITPAPPKLPEAQQISNRFVVIAVLLTVICIAWTIYNFFHY